MKICPNCGSDNLRWYSEVENMSGAVQGKLQTHDMNDVKVSLYMKGGNVIKASVDPEDYDYFLEHLNEGRDSNYFSALGNVMFRLSELQGVSIE